MAGGQPGEAARLINRLFRDGTVAAMTDGQLLERFAARRGESAEAAFEALVSRHGPMVLRVARGMLRDPHDVDDAFQATFLVLVRKAGSIGERELLGPWLYGVAHRVALKARAVAARRNRREGGIGDDPPDDVADGPWLDLRPVLHEELNRLPEKYRKPVVLCHLQGLTHAEAAVELAWPVGTVSVRLARARKLLKERLTRRGLTVTASLWAAGLASEGASAAVSESLIRSTALAAIQYAAGRSFVAGTVSAGAAILTKRTLTMMLVTRLKWLIVPLAIGLGAGGGVVATRQVMVRSIEARDRERAKELATAQTPKPPAAETADPYKGPPLPPLPTKDRSPFDEVPPAPPNRSPFEGAAEPPAVIEADDGFKAVPPVVRMDRGDFPHYEIGEVSPGYFDLPAPDKKDGTDPPIIKVGQVIQVEGLEALPGRPISGERVVRPDGTISLGYYGDLKVAGLNRYQIKVKLIEHLNKFIAGEVLGLILMDPEKRLVTAIPPVESGRVFVDESANYLPPDPGQGNRPKPRDGELDQQIAKGRLSLIEERIRKAVEILKARQAALLHPADPKDLDSEVEARNKQLDDYQKIYRGLFDALGQLDEIRSKRSPAAPAVPDPAKPIEPSPDKPTEAKPSPAPTPRRAPG